MARGGRSEPERTCVGCRGRGSKRDLLRVVRAADGSIALDPSGKAQGRGAYVHPDPACLSAAFRRGGLARALRTDLSPGELGNLQRQLQAVATEPGAAFSAPRREERSEDRQ